MTRRSEQPDWSLLPAQPQGFFALPDEFDRKQLKRAYNRLLRLYKPEKYPAEFQRIRAAFEQLDLELRYGRSLEVEPFQTSGFQWDDLAYKSSPSSSKTGGGPQRQLLLHERLETESPKSLYEELSRREQKDPYDFFALAVLSDVVDRKDPMLFARWLLRGLKEHPHDHGLLQLMRDYLREMETSPTLVKLLIACSQAVPSDEFFPLTEPAWENLLREHSFKSCVETLTQCQSNLRDIGITGQLVFMIRMLRFAIWRDPTEWKDRAMDFVEENYEQIPGHMEFELEVLAAANRYVALRNQFLNGDPLRYRLDQAMEGYFTLDQVEGDRKVLECQLSMLDDSEEIFAAFPIEESEPCEMMHTLWAWLSEDVGERLGLPEPEELNAELWLGRCSALLSQCSVRATESAGGWRWQAVQIGKSLFTYALYPIMAIILLAVFIALAISVTLLKPESEVGVWLAIIILSALGGMYSAHKLTAIINNKYWHSYCERQASLNYRKYWRREILDFLNRSELPFHYACQLLAHTKSDDMGTWATHFMQQDYGLAVFTTARRFLI